MFATSVYATVKVQSGLWKSMAVTSIMYGMDVLIWTESDSELVKLDAGQKNVANSFRSK